MVYLDIECLKKLKRKYRHQVKKRWANEQFRQKMIEIGSNPNGIYKSPEFRNKISQLVKGQKNPNYNRRWSKEQRDRLSKKLIENETHRGIKNGRATEIICMETGEKFKLIKDAMEKYSIKDYGSIIIAIKEPYRTAGGLHWSYYNKEMDDDDYRFDLLLNSIAKSSRTHIVCVETKEIYSTRKEFLDKYNITKGYFNYHYSSENGISVNNNKYIYAKDYVSRTHK